MDIDRLTTTLQERVTGEVCFDHESLVGASWDFGGVAESKPQVVVWPENADDVIAIVGTAPEMKTWLSVRGAGHSQGGQALNRGGIVIQTQRLNRIQAFSETDRWITADAGMLWSDLVGTTAEHDLLPPVLTDQLKVEYADGLAGTVRPAGLIPRNEPAFAFICGAADGMADGLGPVAAIRDDDGGSPGDTLAEYAYLGIGRIVQEAYPEPEVRLDYDSGTPAEYAGFDRFDRVIDHVWYAYAASADRDRYTYGYDRASNRLYRENTLTSGRDELYGYDGVDRLIAFQRGELNANKDGITGTPAREEDWSLDMTGNWPGFVQKTSGSTDLDQGRTHNPVNEITAITASTGADWADPVHDPQRQHDHHPEAGQPGRRPDRHLRRLEPAGRGQRRPNGHRAL